MINTSVARANVFQKIDFAMDMTIVLISAMNSIVQVLTKSFSILIHTLLRLKYYETSYLLISDFEYYFHIWSHD